MGKLGSRFPIIRISSRSSHLLQYIDLIFVIFIETLKLKDMRKSVLLSVLFLVSISISVSAQFEDDLRDYSDTVSSIDDAGDGVKCVIKDVGYVYQYGEDQFGYDEVKNIIDECNYFLKANNLDFDIPHRQESSVAVYADDADYFYLTIVEMLAGEFIRRCWYIDSDNSEYAVYLLMDIKGIEFSVEQI